MAEKYSRMVPETSAAELERYRLRTVSGRRALLHTLAEHQALAGLFDGERLVVTVRILSAKADRLELQLARDESAPTDSRPLTLVAFLDDVKVQLPIRPGPLSMVDRLWTVPFPEVVWRLQRRRGYRVRPPRDRAVWVRVRLPDGSLNLRAEDLSVVGLGLLMGRDGTPPKEGTTWEEVQLHFVIHGVPHLVPCALVVRRVSGGVLGRPWRIGGVLEGLPLPSAQTLHQFVVDLELADRARRYAIPTSKTAEP